MVGTDDQTPSRIRPFGKTPSGSELATKKGIAFDSSVSEGSWSGIQSRMGSEFIKIVGESR
ncbi:MAG: hypothetical protein QG650_842 [Patescibacteria group bacterium]|nr:hypothetical protein [Patescibacteria group bacterium]